MSGKLRNLFRIRTRGAALTLVTVAAISLQMPSVAGDTPGVCLKSQVGCWMLELRLADGSVHAVGLQLR